MKVQQISGSPFGTNCYAAINEETKEALLIDPAMPTEEIQRHMQELKVKPRAILLTHGHFDHIYASREAADAFQIPLYIGKDDIETAEQIEYNLSGTFGFQYTVKPDKSFHDGEIVHLAGFQMKVIFTPGHTKGGCCYYFPDAQIIFCGDTLFCHSIGRTDLPTGDHSALIRSIKDKLMTLGDDIAVYPGHMEETTIGEERRNNPFIQ